MQQNNYTKGVFYLLLFICIIASGVILKLAAAIVVPVVFSILLSLVMLPLLRKLQSKFHIPWIFSAVLILLISMVFIAATGNLLISSLRRILSLYPRYEIRLKTIYEVFAKTFRLPFNETYSLIENLWDQLGIRNAIQSAVLTLSGDIISFSKTFIMIMLLILFLVSELHYMREKINVAFPTPKLKGRVKHVFNNIIREITNFISIKFIISFATGALVGTGTYFVGLEFPVVWGFIAFILNFIPNFGSIFSSILTIFFALIQFYPAVMPTVIVACIMIVVNVSLGTILEPRITGSNLGLSPFIILVSLSIWGEMWGFAGFLLAVPVTVILKIICENISFLHPIAIFLGNHPEETKKQLSAVDESEQTSPETESSNK
ncbi:AI-2E family transporter [Treponema parvum]|uniref:AI-2E family transporter n=1 Tax=Treponema parvum TaxID=138851 RepID=UPI001AEBEF42|nr:AI-2E family transporter [Treponema parvum]QTQ16666.1 AI-2E family transporter [Treponema parvum]